MGYVLGFDVGSQSLKGVLVTPSGDVTAEASSSYEMSFPKPGFAEQDARAWVDALSTVTRSLLSGSGVRAADIGTVGVAAQLDGVVPVGDDGTLLHPAVLWMDRRATEECRILSEAISAESVFGITGLNLDAAHVAPKAMWLRTHEPEVFAQSSWLPSPASFLVERLTGERVVDRTNASSTMLYDVRARSWSAALLDATGLDEAQFGRLVASGEIVGTLTSEVCRMLGLTPGTKVVAGCGDDHGGCLGAGLVRPGMVCDVVGTAEPIAATASEPIFDDTRLVETHDHAADDLWLIQNPGFVSGGSIRWYCDLVGASDPAAFIALARQAPPGAGGVLFLPCLGGATAPVWDDGARGAFCGMTLAHDRSHLARAVLEGCAFAFRDITDRLLDLEISNGSEVRVVGGGAASPLWCQIKADVTGHPLQTVASRHATAVGAAMLATVAEGEFATLADAADALVQLGAMYEPEPANRSHYDEAYARYGETFSALQAVRSLN